MKFLRTDRASLGAAILLGALVALLLHTPARAAEPFRLDRIGVVRFDDLGAGRLARLSGVLTLEGELLWRIRSEIARPADTPDWALGRTLIANEAWLSYRALGHSALENFMLTDGYVRFAIGAESFHFVAPNPLAAAAAGRLVNLSARARVAAGGDEVVAGFVIGERSRTVLIRAVGPTLARFGVAGPAPDPSLTVQQGGRTLGFDDNWSAGPAAEALRAAARRVGAFPLDEGSRDAARLLVLPPGAYTVHVRAAGPDVPGGQVLVEVYSVPEETAAGGTGGEP